MAITVDDSVARWSGSVSAAGPVNITSGSFTPPNNSLLVLCISLDTAANTNVTPTVSGGGLTWTLRAEADEGTDTTTSGGHASIYTAPVTTGSSMTIVVGTSEATTRQCSCKVYIVTGQHASPIGASSNAHSTTNNATLSVTATGAGRMFGCGTDWNALGAGTTSPTSTDVESADTFSGAIDVISAYASSDHTSGSVGINFDAAGASAPDWNLAVLEILAAAGSTFTPRMALMGVG